MKYEQGPDNRNEALGECGLDTRKYADHNPAWTHGGETEMYNNQTLCRRCNGGKSDLTVRE